MKVKVAGQQDLTTQVYFDGEAMNASDSVLQGIQNAQQRASVIVPFAGVAGSSVGAIAGTFDVVLGVTAASAPSLSISNTSATSRNPEFRSGDNWTLALSGASASARIYLRLWRDNVDLGVSGPYGATTDGNGAWSMTGSFGSQDAGAWQLQAVIGSASSDVASTRLSISIS